MQYLKDVVRTRIVNAAIAEFKEYGYSNASIRNIAETAAISLGNIYRYYENKEDLFLTIINPLTDMVKQPVISAVINDDVTLERAIEIIVNYIHEHIDEYKIVRVSNTAHYSYFFDRLSDLIAKKVEQVQTAKRPMFIKSITNKSFFNIIATAYLNSVLNIIDTEEDFNVAQKYILEISNYFFKDLI